MTTQRFTADEDALVAMHRAFTAFIREWTRLDNTLDEPRPEHEWTILLQADGSGDVVCDPEDPNEPTTRPAGWHDIHDARAAIDRMTQRLVEERQEREQRSQRSRPGDPRKGKPRKPRPRDPSAPRPRDPALHRR